MTDPTEPLDELDLLILDQLAAVHAAIDPPPADLDVRVQFALELDQLEIEVARRTDDALAGSGARASERTQTMTFEAASRTVMITVVERPDGLVRIDGWLAPAASLTVELRFPEPIAARTEVADAVGRFVFDSVERGLAQLLIHSTDAGVPQVVTPSLVL